ncbi:uncharacterized protein DUF4397 [Lacibacter cauensis]|uniref:Uncharacterized protein DUF4397 n=1 Tax=Lacibacter cauensis TaxID=510947 RepID=A0A562SWT2_9BACT|nr:DUF4397 domain-containing protein [Lacibacter cauensis]TWI85266.1 uncharacterized protein DUF4397 [Lacibacter cauensis]
MKRTTIFLATAALLFSSLAFVSCKKEKKEEARVLVTHASPDAPGVDLLVDNQKVNASALTFPNSTGYLTVTAGTRNIKVNAAGTTTTVINADIPFVKDKNYSVYAFNRLASIGAILVEDDLTTPASGKAHIRFFHLSPGAPAVTVGVLAGSTFTPVFSNRSFETQATAAANQAFAPVDAGTYTFDVRVAGTTNSVLTLTGINLQAGKIYTVFARGIVGNTTTPLGASIIAHN